VRSRIEKTSTYANHFQQMRLVPNKPWKWILGLLQQSPETTD